MRAYSGVRMCQIAELENHGAVATPESLGWGTFSSGWSDVRKEVYAADFGHGHDLQWLCVDRHHDALGAA